MGLFMGFDRVDRIQFSLRDEIEESFEIEASFTDGEMLIHLFMIIVKMDFDEISSQGLNPGGERGLAENMLMPSIKTESEMR